MIHGCGGGAQGRDPAGRESTVQRIAWRGTPSRFRSSGWRMRLCNSARAGLRFHCVAPAREQIVASPKRVSLENRRPDMTQTAREIAARGAQTDASFGGREAFQMHVEQKVLDDLQKRLRRTRWTSVSNDAGWDVGTSTSFLRELTRAGKRPTTGDVTKRSSTSLPNAARRTLRRDGRAGAARAGNPRILSSV